jgi:hypothetical protein
MDPIWLYMARLLEAAQLTRSPRTLFLITLNLTAVGVLGAVLIATCAYALGWRAGGVISDPFPASAARVTLPHTAAAPRNDDRSIPAPAANTQRPRASVDEAACYASLSGAGVTFQTIPRDQTPGVAWPIKLTSAVGGVLIHGGKKDAPTNYLDCRLALALLAWAPSLQEQGVIGLEHFSAYRRDAVIAASTKQSGHALGWAIDVGRFEMRDGRTLSVLDDWKNRDRGAAPCKLWPTDEEPARIMRKLVCDAYEHELFQIVITPHYNDAHNNHVHLEIRHEGEGSSMD